MLDERELSVEERHKRLERQLMHPSNFPPEARRHLGKSGLELIDFAFDEYLRMIHETVEPMSDDYANMMQRYILALRFNNGDNSALDEAEVLKRQKRIAGTALQWLFWVPKEGARYYVETHPDIFEPAVEDRQDEELAQVIEFPYALTESGLGKKWKTAKAESTPQEIVTPLRQIDEKGLALVELTQENPIDLDDTVRKLYVEGKVNRFIAQGLLVIFEKQAVRKGTSTDAINGTLYTTVRDLQDRLVDTTGELKEYKKYSVQEKEGLYLVERTTQLLATNTGFKKAGSKAYTALLEEEVQSAKGVFASRSEVEAYADTLVAIALELLYQPRRRPRFL